MNRSQWQEIERLLQAALDRPEEARDRFLDRACDDPAQRREIDELLAAFDESPAFFEHPGWTSAQTLELLARARPPVAEIDGYTLRHELGQGGMGTVYYATSEERSPEVAAIKLVPAVLNSPRQLSRLRREQRILSNLAHANIARLLDGGRTAEGFHYLILEYVEGSPIDVYCDRNELSIERRLELFRDVCGAVHYAHQNLVVHRDIKPANVLVTEDGTVMLLDFGIAKLLGDAGPTEEVTLDAQRPMTPNYASPEQISGGAVTTNSDIYSLGVLLFQLLTGSVPHHLQGRSVDTMEAVLERRKAVRPSAAVARQATADDTVAPEAREPNIVAPETHSIRCGLSDRLLKRRLEGDLDTIVEVALRRDPGRRYRSADALAEDLDRHLMGLPIQARPSSFWYQSSKIVKRHKLATAAVFSAFLLAVGVAVVMSWQASVIARERDRANLERVRASRTSDFLVDLFENADPYDGAGARLTAQDLADQASLRIRTDFDDQPEVKAALNDRIGRMYFHLGLYAKARPHLEAAVAERTKVGEEQGLSESLRHLALLDLSEGRHDAAERGLEQALAILRRAPLERQGEIAVAERERALVDFARGDYDVAEPRLEAALESLRQAFGPRSLEVADGLYGLAELHRALSRLDRAQALLREALEIHTELLGENHPRVAAVINVIGRVRRQQGDPKAAREAFSRALTILETSLGPTHPALGGPLGNLAIIRAVLGDYDGAEERFQRALAIYEKAFEGPHVKTAHVLSNLAVVADLKGHHELAIESYLNAGEFYRQLQGPDSETVAKVSYNLATLYLEDGELELSEEHALRAREGYQKALGDHHDRVGEALGTLGEIAYYRGQTGVAGEFLDRSIEILEKASERHPHLPWALRLSSLIDLEVGRPEAARAKLGRALDIRREAYDPLHIEVLESENDWARWLLSTGSALEARDLLLELLDRYRGAGGDKLADADFISRRAKTHLLLAEATRRAGPAGAGKDAGRHLERAVELLSELTQPPLPARIDLAQALRELGKHREARQVMQRLQQQGARTCCT